MTWNTIRPDLARGLTDARLQLHYAAQLVAAFGISYGERRADDSHTNLEWLPELGALASRPQGEARVSLRLHDLTLFVKERELALTGLTMEGAAALVREEMGTLKLDGARYTLKRHYELPSHPVAEGAKFSAEPEHLRQLANWFGNAALLLNALVELRSDASEVRCWPHHFDIATLITLKDGKTIGAGMEPGDDYYDEPYFYANMNPAPSADALPDAPSGGRWHKRDWVGAVLPGSKLPTDPGSQQAYAREFIKSAVSTNERILAGAAAVTS